MSFPVAIVGIAWHIGSRITNKDSHNMDTDTKLLVIAVALLSLIFGININW
jgi:hypothetical protein